MVYKKKKNFMNLFYDCAIIPQMRDRFAEKMKRMTITLISLIIAACTLSAQKTSGHMKSMLGADFGASLKNRYIKFHAGHQILDRWSAGGWLSFRLNERKTDQEEAIHKNEFSDKTQEIATERDILQTAGLYFQFWTAGTYEGPFISLGAAINEKGREDCTIGIGYCMNIWKWISVSASLEMHTIESFKTQKFKGEGTGLCICITF